MKNAIAIQDTAIAEILAAKEQGSRAMSSGRSLLNRNPRVLRGIRNRMAEALFKCGYTMEQASAAWFDACDMALLQDAATDDQN